MMFTACPPFVTKPWTASELLASSLDYEVTLQRLATPAVPELADWCATEVPRGGTA